MREQSTLPNFIIGGVAAGGTSFLADVLVQHPEIFLPKEMRPEPHFFYKSWEYEKGIDYYKQRWFGDVPVRCTAIGERSSSYLFGGKSVAEKMSRVIPGVRLVFTLRNPIERTWANYRYTVLQGLEDLSFEKALKDEESRVRSQSGVWAEIQPFNYTGRGCYASQLKDFLQYFPREQILTVKSEALGKHTDSELRRIYQFLGLADLDFQAERAADHTSVNVIDPGLQKRLRSYFGDRFDKVIEATREEKQLTEFIVSEADAEAIGALKENMKGRKEAMPDAARAYLRELFAIELRELRGLVDFDISDWN
jgi:sulfotransferase family protein